MARRFDTTPPQGVGHALLDQRRHACRVVFLSHVPLDSDAATRHFKRDKRSTEAAVASYEQAIAEAGFQDELDQLQAEFDGFDGT